MPLFVQLKLFKRDIYKNLEHLFGGWKTYLSCFVFTPSVGVKYFWVDLNGMAYFYAYP